MSKKRKPAPKGTGRNPEKQVKKPTGNNTETEQTSKPAMQMPTVFPFWARLKISKNRTTLVIDEALVPDKQKKKKVPGYVHREATSVEHKGFEEINPNPDKKKKKPMYLKPARKLPKRLFEPHNKPLDMPEDLRKRYEGNNHKGDKDGNGDKKT